MLMWLTAINCVNQLSVAFFGSDATSSSNTGNSGTQKSRTPKKFYRGRWRRQRSRNYINMPSAEVHFWGSRLAARVSNAALLSDRVCALVYDIYKLFCEGNRSYRARCWFYNCREHTPRTQPNQRGNKYFAGATIPRLIIMQPKMKTFKGPVLAYVTPW